MNMAYASSQAEPVAAGMGLLAVLVFGFAQIYPWMAVFRYLRWRGLAWWIGQPAGFLWGSVCSLFSVGLLASLEELAVAQIVFCAVFLAPLAYGTWRMRQRVKVQPAPTVPDRTPSLPGANTAPTANKNKNISLGSLVNENPSPPIKPDEQAIEATRRQSLDAANRATTARKADMAARGEKPAERIGWATNSSSLGTGFIATIEFDYLDAKGNRSHRTVDVTAVDKEYFEGYCHKALDTRTFVIGRVRGKVLVRDTGELLAAKQWAADARRDSRNGEITMGGTWKPDQEDDGEDIDLDLVPFEAIGAEILFTGFSKSDRADLEELAEGAGMEVRKSVTQFLDYLCTGPNAGPSKLSQAEATGAEILDRDEFMDLLRGK